MNQVTWICLQPTRKRTLKLQTFYLYGLNEKGSVGNKSSNTDEVVVRKFFPSLSRNGRREVIQPRYTVIVETHQVFEKHIKCHNTYVFIQPLKY